MTFRKCRFIGSGVLLSCALLGLRADPLIIPHLADGGGWKTTLVLTNTSTSLATVKLAFHMETAAGLTVPWNPPFMEVGSTDNLTMPGGSTLFLHTNGTSRLGAGAVGWGEVQTSGAVQVYAVFTSVATPGSTAEGTAPASTGASRLLMPFDNTNGRFTALALATNSTTDQTVAVTIRSNNGTITKGTLPTLPAAGHTSFLLTSLTSPLGAAATGQEGLVEFTGSAGSLSGIALRFNANTAFTSAPMYPQFGSPVVGVTQETLQVGSLTFPSSTIPSGGTLQGTVTLTAAAPGGITVLLSSNSTSISVPPSVFVPAGSATATFTVTAATVTSNLSGTISAQYGNTVAAQLTVTAP